MKTTTKLNVRNAVSPKRTLSGGGGPFRAFISERCKGIGSAIFKHLAAEYRGLSDDERARFVSQGTLATLAHRRGRLGFGMFARTIANAMTRDAAHRRAIRSAEHGTLDVESLAFSSAPPNVANIRESFTNQRANMILMHRIRKEELHHIAADVAAWRGSSGIRIRDNAIVAIPRLVHLACGRVG